MPEGHLREMRLEPAVEAHALLVAGDGLLAHAAHASTRMASMPIQKPTSESTTEKTM